MKRVLPLLAAAVATAIAGPALAATKAAKPTTVTMYFHGTSQVAQQDTEVGGELLPMNRSKPSGSSDKYYPFFGAVQTPNTECAGSPLFANWFGDVSGQLTGKATVRFYAVSTPASTARVQLFDNGTASACNSSLGGSGLPPLLGETSVALPSSPGLVTAVIPIKGMPKVHGALDVQIQVADFMGKAAPQLSNVFFDSSASPSSVTFSCLPKPGRKTC